MAKNTKDVSVVTVTVTQVEKTILQIAVERHLNELEKVLKKARELGIEVTKATQVDVETIGTLKKKLEGQEALKM